MTLGVSNIAWPAELRRPALEILAEAGITNLEAAPTMEWPEWRFTPAQVSEFKQEVNAAGFNIGSLQSILFAKPAAQLFGDQESRGQLAGHLEWCAQLAAELGAGPLVFGAPKNRLRGGLSPEAATEAAAETLRKLAPAFERTNTCLCLEANPVDYGCDFLTRAGEAAELVRAIGRPGIGLHLDTACMHLAGDPAGELIGRNADILRHFHVSEPFLGGFESPVAPHAAAAAALHEIDYQGLVVLEMRASAQPLDALRQAVGFLTSTYGGRTSR